MDSAALSTNLVPGSLLADRYRIESIIGQGGMGAVYLARLEALGNKPVAIKEMRVQASDPTGQEQAVNQFRQEASFLANLEHPNLVQVTDFFADQGRYYLVMAYVKGQNLAELIDSRQDPFPIATILDWAQQLTAVLAYLHGQTPPILFRDLKPSNILLDTNNKIRLIDFGIARHFNPDQVTATFLQGVGSAGYSPLEQYQGSGSTDQRSDLYSLGATLYNLLTGEVPPSPVMLITEGKLVQGPSRKNPSVPPALDHIVTKLMALRKDDRYQTVGEVALVLRNLAQSLSQGEQTTEAYLPGLVAGAPSPTAVASSAPVNAATSRQSHRTTQVVPGPTASSAPISVASATVMPQQPVDPHEKYLWLVIGTLTTVMIGFVAVLIYKMPGRGSVATPGSTSTPAAVRTPAPIDTTPEVRATGTLGTKPVPRRTPDPVLTRRPRPGPSNLPGTPHPPRPSNSDPVIPSVDNGQSSIPSHPVARPTPIGSRPSSPVPPAEPSQMAPPIQTPSMPVSQPTPEAPYNPYARYKGRKEPPPIQEGYAPPAPDGKDGWKPDPHWVPPAGMPPPPLHHRGPGGPGPDSSQNPYDRRPNGY